MVFKLKNDVGITQNYVSQIPKMLVIKSKIFKSKFCVFINSMLKSLKTQFIPTFCGSIDFYTNTPNSP